MPTKKETSTKTQETKKTAKAVKVTLVKAEKPVVKTTAKTNANPLLVPMFGLDGASSGNLSLPEAIFGAKVNTKLLGQAMRVYLNNEKGHFANTKTRGEVDGSTRKIYRQKGTGNARHGAIRAPIFVGGGIALGPKSRSTLLELPKKMKQAALVAALSQKALQSEILALSDLNKATGKTSQMAKLFAKLETRSTLVITDTRIDNAIRSVKNLSGVSLLSVDQLNALEVIKHKSVILTKEAVEQLEIRIAKVSRASKVSGAEDREARTSKRGAK